MLVTFLLPIEEKEEMIDITNATALDIRKNIEEFEAALNAQEPELRKPSIKRVLLAVDRSNLLV